jgi:His/Glu/Gln/Arg/opine family amino acid ABC transporter permease subunit
MEIVIKTLEIKFPLLVSGTILTIVSAIISIVLAMILGIVAGFGRLSNVTVIRSISAFYVETIRGTPLYFQLLVWFFGIKLVLVTLFNFNVDSLAYDLLTTLNSNSLFPATGVSNLVFGIIGLSVNYGAYIAEVVRAGVQSVDHGQTEAALSLGLSRFQVARHIVLPQALRIMIPPLTNNFITLIQDTSFFLGLGVAELAFVSQTAAQASSSSLTIRWTVYLVELAIYFVICYSLATISGRTERRVAHTLAGAH